MYHSPTKEHLWAKNLTSLPKRGVSALRMFPCLTTKGRPCHIYSTLEANNWTKNNVQLNHQRLLSEVLTTHNSEWHHVTMSMVLLIVHTALATSIYTLQKVSYFSTWGYASHTPRKARSRLDTHSSEVWPYTGKWTKSKGWALFCEWALFRKTMVLS